MPVQNWTVQYYASGGGADLPDNETRNGPGPDLAEDEGRSARKRRGILDAATAAFFRSGYLGTSMDQIAAQAAVSKQTVYKQFTDKESLFTEIVLNAVNNVWEPLQEDILRLQDTSDVAKDL